MGGFGPMGMLPIGVAKRPPRKPKIVIRSSVRRTDTDIFCRELKLGSFARLFAWLRWLICDLR
jgi:hypothetical protein